jgi:hypothetical protein
VIVTLACVYVGALAELLHLEPFPPPWWLVVVAAASTAMSLEPFKRQHR